MDLNFSNIWHEWHNYLVTWTRDRAPKLALILLLAFVFVRVLVMITRKVVSLSEKSSGGTTRAQQVRTVAGVIRSTGIFLIVFWTGMSALKDAFDINIEPLLASAGIVGLAIGFGAQTLVKDVINGFFILVENQYEVGNSIRIAGVSGTVETINMRTTTLRDSDGTLHVVPNSTIQIVSNMTRDWSQVSLHVAVDYSEDSERVVHILQEVAQDLSNNSEHKKDLVAVPVVHGIERMHGREVDYLVTVKVRPGSQHQISRDLRRRIKACFEKNKIKAGTPGQVYTANLPASDH